MTENPIWLSDIKLNGDSEFCNKFNKMHDLWQRYKETQDMYDYNKWFDYKLSLEMGMV